MIVGMKFLTPTWLSRTAAINVCAIGVALFAANKIMDISINQPKDLFPESITSLKDGTIILGSGAEIRTGAWMFRGTIVSLMPLQLLPTFAHAATYTPTFLRIYANHLRTLGVTIPIEPKDGAYQRYTGDNCVPGKGEIFVWRPASPSPPCGGGPGWGV